MGNRLAPFRVPRTRDECGFTLTELLAVVVTIGVLVAVAVPVYGNQRDSAKLRSTAANAYSLISEVYTAREAQQRSLRLVVGYTFSTGQCLVDLLPKVADTGFAAPACGVRWNNIVTRLATASGSSRSSVAGLLTDGWGRPMLFNENEGVTFCTSRDTVRSAATSATLMGTGSVVYFIPLSGFC